MLKKLDRYILKEIFPPFLVGLFAYTFVLLLNQIFFYSEMFIARGVAFQTVGKLFLYLIPSMLAFTIPMSLLLGVLAGLSRMSSDMEITALKTLGVSYRRLLQPILLFAFIAWALTSVLNLYLGPESNHRWIKTFSGEVLRKIQIKVNPRTFDQTLPTTTIYVQDVLEGKTWKNIFIHSAKPDTDPRLILAREGRLIFNPEEETAFLQLVDGTVHTSSPAAPEDYNVVFFDKLQEPIDIRQILSGPPDGKGVREKTFDELLKDGPLIKKELDNIPEEKRGDLEYRLKKIQHVRHRVEIHKKIAIPLACFIFAFLALPLGATTRKGGRASGFTVSIGIILLYYILVTAGEQLAREGSLSPWLAMWGPNILFLFVAVYFFSKALNESSPLAFLFQKRKKTSDRKRPAPPLGRSGRSLRLSLPFPNILDRYILRKYLFIFTLAFVSMVAIFIIVIFFEQIHEVYKHNKSLRLFLEYIWYQLPAFVQIILPVASLVAALLSLGLLTKFNEVTAMKACGISLYRIIIPVLFMAVLFCGVSYYLQENIVPYTNRKMDQKWAEIRDVPPRSYSVLDRQWVMGMERDRIYHYLYLEPLTSSFSNLSILELDSDSWSIRRRIFTERATFPEKGGGLRVTKGWERLFVDGRPVEYNELKDEEVSIPENRDFFLTETKEADMMSYAELKSYIADIQTRNFETREYEINLQYKLSFPLAGLVMVLLGVPFAFSMGKRGTLVGIGMSLLISLVFWISISLFKNLGIMNYLTPFLAAWGPNLLFGLIGCYAIFTLRT
ncbi:MAG: LPS export ABC transporter permease LptF [Candidatus Aminicenantes bacterium]|nr:LPS export ABC transporter permease LptF [Candidatus Aminicenantes bacterium]